MGRPMWLNLTIYFLTALYLVSCGILYVVALKTKNEREQKKRYNTLKVAGVVGIMVLGVLIAISSAINEWAWLEKCDQIQNFVDTKMSYLKRSLNPQTLVRTLGDQVKGALKSELSRQTGGLL
jgi:hypothetical protein